MADVCREEEELCYSVVKLSSLFFGEQGTFGAIRVTDLEKTVYGWTVFCIGYVSRNLHRI